MKPRRQPTFPPGMRSAPEEFVVCYPPTEDGHLTEEQKKWPRVSEEWPRDAVIPPASTPATEPKPPAQAG